LKILLADDDAVSRRLLQRTLERSGFDVVCVADGESAAQYLQAPDGPRIAILDWVMPGKDGPTVCRELRARTENPYVYLILLTSREAMEDLVIGFEAGADDYLIKPCNPDELKARLRAGQRILLLQDSLIHEAQHDTLTKLPNRAFFIKRLSASVSKARELPAYQFTLLFVDIDRFKMINDSLGHSTGDELIKRIAERLMQAVRMEVIHTPETKHRRRKDWHGDLVARIGGDEFVILLDNFAELSDGIRVADRVQHSLQEVFAIGDNEIFISASIGISTSGGDLTNAAEMLRGADIATYKAKLLGKARYQISDSTANCVALDQLKLENDLRHAIDNKEFALYYQPIVDMIDGTIVSFEALVRWQHPTRGIVLPTSFLPLAEETGLIVPISDWVLREACRQIQEWNEELYLRHPATVCVNISPRQFGEGNLVTQVSHILQETGLHHSFLHLEVTENLTMSDATRAGQVLNDLSDMGISLSLDDFGTGFSSLSYLMRFPIRTLKIDRSFISEIESSSESAHIVQTIINLGHNLGMKVVAEGIENMSQMRLLRALSCDYGQGYLFSRPIPPVEVVTILQAKYPFSSLSVYQNVAASVSSNS
jgi:predicted signal transduction protein with EAL and GGDEF domain